MARAWSSRHDHPRGGAPRASFAWSPWKDATEVEWLGTYRAWSNGIGAALPTGLVMSQNKVRVDVRQRRGRAAAGAAPAGSGGRAARLRCIDSRRVAERQGRRRACADRCARRPSCRRAGAATSPTSRAPASASSLTSSAGSPPVAAPLSEQYAIVRGGEERRHRLGASPTTQGTASTSIPPSALRSVSICAGCARTH